MKVNTWKNVDVDVEVDVSLDDCINEFLDMANDEDAPRRRIAAIDGASRIMDKVTPEDVKSCLDKHPEAVQILRQRLATWIAFIEQHKT